METCSFIQAVSIVQKLISSNECLLLLISCLIALYVEVIFCFVLVRDSIPNIKGKAAVRLFSLVIPL